MPTRRTVLKRSAVGLVRGGLTWLAILRAPAIVAESMATPALPDRQLWLHRVQTQEEGQVVYYQDNALVPDGYALLCYLLRDVRAEQIASMDLKLIHLLFGMQAWMRACGIRQPLRIASGYRTAKTHADTEGAAVHSRHRSGQAADLTVAGIPSEVLAKLARQFNAGGVGVYPSFVHVDTGPVRGWTG